MCCAWPPPPLLLLQRYVLTLEEKRGAFVPPALRENTLFTATGEHGGTGEFSHQPLWVREREQVTEKSSFVSSAEQKKIFSGLDNRASVGPCPYYYTSKACLHWVWYCLDFSTATIVDHAELCKEVLAFPLSPSSLPHFICFSPFQVSFSKNHQKGFLFGCWGRFPLTVVR